MRHSDGTFLLCKALVQEESDREGYCLNHVFSTSTDFSDEEGCRHRPDDADVLEEPVAEDDVASLRRRRRMMLGIANLLIPEVGLRGYLPASHHVILLAIEFADVTAGVGDEAIRRPLYVVEPISISVSATTRELDHT